MFTELATLSTIDASGAVLIVRLPDADTAERGTTVAAAMLDRLLHRSVVINHDGDSYRLRDHHARNDQLRRITTGTRQPLRCPVPPDGESRRAQPGKFAERGHEEGTDSCQMLSATSG